MNRKKARFDVVSIEISVHCPSCGSVASVPLTAPPRLTWNEIDIRRAIGHDVPCVPCGRRFRLDPRLSNLLAPSTDPVRTDRRVSAAHIEIICANCAGDAVQPTKTLMTTNQRCAGCGGTNFVLANNHDGKEHSNASQPADPKRTATANS